MRINTAVVQGLVDHGGMGGHDAASDKAKRWPCVFVKAGEVDGGVHRVAGWVDHTDGV